MPHPAVQIDAFPSDPDRMHVGDEIFFCERSTHEHGGSRLGILFRVIALCETWQLLNRHESIHMTSASNTLDSHEMKKTGR